MCGSGEAITNAQKLSYASTAATLLQNLQSLSGSLPDPELNLRVIAIGTCMERRNEM